MFVWQFLPEYLFPFVAYLAPLCWFASKNHTANFLGSGKGGIGLLNITLDWSNITSTVITYPYSVQVTVFTAFVITVSWAITISSILLTDCEDLDSDPRRISWKPLGISNLKHHVQWCFPEERIDLSG